MGFNEHCKWSQRLGPWTQSWQEQKHRFVRLCLLNLMSSPEWLTYCRCSKIHHCDYFFYFLFVDKQKINSLSAISWATRFSIYKDEPGSTFYCHLSTYFLPDFFNAENPRQFNQLSALNRSNFPKIEPNRLWAWMKDHKPGTPSRSTSSSSLPLPWHLDPSKTQSIQLVSFLSYFSNILLPLVEHEGQWKKPQTEVAFVWSPGVTQPELRFSERPLPLTPDKRLYESMGAEFWVASVVSNWRFATLWTCRPPGSPVHGILQARILEWVAISSSRGSSQPSDQNHISCSSCIAGRFFMAEPPWKASWINNRFQFSPLSKSLLPDTSPPVSIPTRHNLGRAGASSKSLQGLESLDTEYTDLLLLFLKRMFICSKCISFRARPPETTGKHSKGIWQGTSGYCNTDAKQMGPHFLQSIQYKPGTALFFWADFSSQVDQLALWMNTLSWAEGSIMAVARGQFFRLTALCPQPNEHPGLCTPLSCHDFTLRCGCVPRLKSRDVL